MEIEKRKKENRVSSILIFSVLWYGFDGFLHFFVGEIESLANVIILCEHLRLHHVWISGNIFLNVVENLLLSLKAPLSKL